MPAHERPRTKIQTRMRRASQPCIPAPAPRHQATNPEQPAEQELPNTPNLAEPILNQQLVGPGSPQTRSANLGFEIRGFSCPRHRHRLSPKQPHATNFTKQVYQTNPIPTASDNAIAPATGHPPPPVTQKPNPAKSAKPVCQTDPIPKNQSRSTSHGHLPLTESRISLAVEAIENHRIADLPRCCGNRSSREFEGQGVRGTGTLTP